MENSVETAIQPTAAQSTAVITEAAQPDLPPAAGPAEISRLGRWLAVAQQAKDTVTILGLNIVLLFGILIYGMAVPGLVLYGMRWRLARGKATRTQALWLWALGLVHEALCVLLFSSAEAKSEFQEMAVYLTYGYTLGACISLAGLLTTVSTEETHPA